MSACDFCTCHRVSKKQISIRCRSRFMSLSQSIYYIFHEVDFIFFFSADLRLLNSEDSRGRTLRSIQSRIRALQTRIESLNQIRRRVSSTSSSDIEIREATIDDLEEIKVLYEDALLTYSNSYPVVKKFVNKAVKEMPKTVSDSPARCGPIYMK